MEHVLKTKIEQADVVSFDIFDTLIVRACRQPTDVFRLVEELEEAEGFAATRVKAEQTARAEAKKSGHGEVTLEEIYEKLPQRLRYMQAQEILWEKRLSHPYPEMKAVYDVCRAMKKRIILTSDMYLPQEVIEDLLQDAGYEGWEKLYLSSTCGIQKATGELYDFVREELGGIQILHIGDNAFTDGEMARTSGWDSYVIPTLLLTSGEMHHAAYFAVLNEANERSLLPSLLEGLIALRHAAGEHDYWEDFGYQYAGVMALGYVNWIARELEQTGLHRVYFMMRDGYIFEQLFDKMYPGYESRPIYGSRTMFCLSGMRSYEDIRLHITGIHRQGLTPRRCYERLAIEDDALWAKFEKNFTELDSQLHDEADFQAIDDFFIEHESRLLALGKQQRAVIVDYFEEIGLFDGPCAIIDIGWKGSMLRGIEQICAMEGRQVEIEGYYMGTHPCNLDGLSVHTYGMSLGEPKNIEPESYLCDPYIVKVIEAIFTAPFPSILCLSKENGKISPVYKKINKGEEKNFKVVQGILHGIFELQKDIQLSGLGHIFDCIAHDSLVPLAYLKRKISRRDEIELYGLYCYPGAGNDTWRLPISRRDNPTFAIIFTWPSSINAEREVIIRIQKAAGECGYQCYVINNYGYLLDDNMDETSNKVPEVDFVISVHFLSPKYLDAFYYFTVWNPPEYSLDYEGSFTTDIYPLFDDYLLAKKDSVSVHHLQSLLLTKRRNLISANIFASSCSVGGMLSPDILDNKNLSVFYCGVNWDILVSGKGRNEGLMKLLDHQGMMKYFGPNDNWGKHPWEGYECYQKEIPFDGISVPREIHKCGICLALSSDEHRRTGIATNRVFEACAAGAVIISDDNEMVREMFGDAVLYIDYNRNDIEDTCQQIIKQYNWVVHNREEAQTLAEKSQRIFCEKYSLNVFLNNLMNHHAERARTIAHDVCARDEHQTVAVFYVCNTLNLNEAKLQINCVLKNITHQDYMAIIPLIAVDCRIASILTEYVISQCASARVVPMRLYDKFEARCMTDGQAIAKLRHLIAHSYFMITNSDEFWYYDHVTALVRSLEDDIESDASYGIQVYIHDGCCDYHNFKIEPKQMHFVDGGGKRPGDYLYPYPGIFLFRAECHKLLPDETFDYLDGCEYVAYIHRIVYHARRKVSFSKRVSFAFKDEFKEEHHLVLSAKREYNFILALTAYDRPRYHLSHAMKSDGISPAAPVNNKISALTNEEIYARFIFPFEAVPAGTNIVIYGGGIVGKTYLEQLIRSNYCTIKAICDKNPKGTGIQQIPVISLKELAGLAPQSYDMVLIAIERRDIAKEIREELEMMGLPMSKVRWIDPQKKG